MKHGKLKESLNRTVGIYVSMEEHRVIRDLAIRRKCKKNDLLRAWIGPHIDRARKELNANRAEYGD